MRTSHLLIRKRILEVKSSITDEQFFASREYSGFLTDIAESATKRYNRTVRVTVKADHDDETVAFTDFTGIMINACNEITWSFPSRPLRSLSLQGLNAHEFGHMLFTDNPVWHSFFRRLERGRFYPRLPDGLNADQMQYADEIREALLDENDPVPRSVILNTAHALSNILEDGYVDLKCSCQYPGTPARGIALNNLRYAELMPDIEAMIDRKTYDHNVVLNLLIQYVRVRELNNLSGYEGELLDYLKSFMALVDGCICADDARDRCEAVNLILIDLWPVMQRCFDELRAKYDQAVKAAQGTGQAMRPASSSQAALKNRLTPRRRRCKRDRLWKKHFPVSCRSLRRTLRCPPRRLPAMNPKLPLRAIRKPSFQRCPGSSPRRPNASRHM